MNKENVLQIITSSFMEGNGFKSFIEQNKPYYGVELKLVSVNTCSHSDLSNNLECPVNKNSIVIIDTDSLEDEELFDLLSTLIEHEIKGIIYSNLSTPGLIIKSREMLISGYVSKKSSLNCLLNCLDVVELGGTYYDSCFSDLLKQIMNFEKGLSVSEKKLLEAVLLFNNRTIKELSEMMHISKHTVEVHLSNLYKKAGVSCYNELVSKFSL